MRWNIIARVGELDDYDAVISKQEPRIYVGVDRPNDTWEINNNVLMTIHEKTGKFPPASALDLLHLAFAVYSADLEVERVKFQSRWSREFLLHLPVSDLQLWNDLSPLIVQLLEFLTGDSFELRLRSLTNYTPTAPERIRKPTLTKPVDRVALFSGGLDSLVGAIDFLEKGETVALTGHYGKGKTNSYQQSVFGALKQFYGDKAVDFMFYAQPPKHKNEGEPSMRSRSLLFLSIGICVASCLEPGLPLAVSENGLISLNVPLTNSRIGSLSTRTTHPYFISLYRDLLRALGLTHEIQTPYRFKTKGEMICSSSNPTVMAQTAKLSISCSHPEAGRFSGHPEGHHCGYCVPCLIRRASMFAANLPDAPYVVDVLTNPPDISSDKGEDLRAFLMALERFTNARPIDSLFRVLATGPLPPDESSIYADVHARGMRELGMLLMPTRFE